ncbi:uncharacterized protein [Narcine bancroftii]|uniref:uncharacterized protein isoform X2 n=1 Tax=Narcine bancroftii TaxID=1343680 RepID=UPI00383122BB
MIPSEQRTSLALCPEDDHSGGRAMERRLRARLQPVFAPRPGVEMSLRILLLASLAPSMRGQGATEARIDVQLEVKNSTTLHIEWDSHLFSIFECVLLIIVEGRKEDEIFLLPRNGSLKLTDRKPGTPYTFSLTCFNGETVLKSSNFTIDTGIEPSTQSLTSQFTSRTKAQSNSDGHWNHAKLLSSDVLTGAVFGCIGGVILIYLSYSFYKKWRRDERLRAFLSHEILRHDFYLCV